jgi:protein PET117
MSLFPPVKRMYQGVLRDDERRRDKQRQRQTDYETSQRNREVFERTQRVNDTLEANNGLTSKDTPD